MAKTIYSTPKPKKKSTFLDSQRKGDPFKTSYDKTKPLGMTRYGEAEDQSTSGLEEEYNSLPVIDLTKQGRSLSVNSSQSKG